MDILKIHLKYYSIRIISIEKCLHANKMKGFVVPTHFNHFLIKKNNQKGV